MADRTDEKDVKVAKLTLLPLIVSLVLALAGGGAGFYAAWSGLVFGSVGDSSSAAEQAGSNPVPDISFIEVAPITISLGPASRNQHLRFRASLEVPEEYEADVTLLLPRVVDVLNGYLRALELSDLENPSALLRLRAQMLRRVRMVAGYERVNDLLVMEFVLN